MRSLLLVLPVLALASPAFAGRPMQIKTAFGRGCIEVARGGTQLVSVPAGQKLLEAFRPYPALFQVEGGKVQSKSGATTYKLVPGYYYGKNGFNGPHFEVRSK